MSRWRYAACLALAWITLASLATVATSRVGQITDQIVSTRQIAPAHVFGTFDSTTLTGGTLSNGDLTFTVVGAGNVVRGKPVSATQKTYGELKITSCSCGAGNIVLGVISSLQTTVSPTSIATVPALMWAWRDDALKINNGTSSAYGSAPSVNDVMDVAFDPVAGKFWLGKNGTWFASGDPVTGANPTYSGLTGAITFVVNYQGTTGTPTVVGKFGPTFDNTVPATFYAP